MDSTYTNGYGDHSPARNGAGGHGLDSPRRDNSRMLDRRPGGYGGLGDRDPFSQGMSRASDSLRSRGYGRGSERSLTTERDRSSRGEGRAAKQLEG